MDLARFYAYVDGLGESLAAFTPGEDLSKATTVYCLSPELQLVAYDLGWVAFARENNGDLSRLGLGVAVMDTVPKVLQSFYRRVYAHCLENGDVWRHHYQCSSATEFRVFEEIVMGMPESRGLIIAHVLQMQTPQPGATECPEPQRFVNPLTDAVGQCAHCRRVVDPHHRRWKLVPEWVHRRPERVDDDLCPACYVSTYRNMGLPA